jgi:beta-glucosidase
MSIFRDVEGTLVFRKIVQLFFFASCLSYAQPPVAEIDTVSVPPVFLKLTGVSGGVYTYRGKVAYRIIGWSNDRFNVSLSLVRDGTGETVPLTMTKGDVGTVAWPGNKGIHFTCSFDGPPDGTYRAKVSIVASRSDTAQAVENLIAGMSNADKQAIINGAGAGGVPATAWQDGSYGIRGGYAYPCGEAMASTFDTALAEEGGVYKGEDFRGLGCNIMLGTSMNLVRDGRSGRSFESYGEDPFLMGKMAAADCRGCTRSGLMVTCKHYCCMNEERAAGYYPVMISERSLRELYAFPFGMAASQGPATGVMTAYNSVNGYLSPQNRHLLTDILKNAWGFKGFILTDWDNGGGNFNACALAGLDLPVPGTWGDRLAAMVPATISQGFFDDKARRWLWSRYKARCFEPGYSIASTFHDSIDNAAHYGYVRRAAREAVVLVKNDRGLLPLDATKPVTIACVGPWSSQMRWHVSAGSEVMPRHRTPLTSALAAVGGANVTVTADYHACDYAIVCVGSDDKGEGIDRVEVSLPDTQDALCAAVEAVKPGKAIVFYTGGSCSDSGAWSQAPAIVMSFFASEDHTLAVAEAIFGEYNPAGRLPFTFPADSTQLPVFGIGYPWNPSGAVRDVYEDAWEGRGYPYYDRHNLKPLFCFGHGLSYTTFAYGNLRVSPPDGYPGDTFHVSVDVTNTGARGGDEVVQLYLHDEQSAQPRRYKDLRGFARVPLDAGRTTTVDFTITERDLEYYDTTQAAWVVEPGPVDVLVGASSLDIRQQGTLTIR